MAMLWLVADVELRHLRTMAAIAEEGTFGRAAARLGYTQSSVSQQIAALERALGGAVFDRPGGPRPVRITPLGEVVLTHGRDLLTKAEALADAVDRFRAGNGRIDIGTFQSVSNLILPAVVRRLLDEHPGCDIRLSEVEPEDPKIGDLDLLFHDGRIEGDVEHVKLLDEPYLLVAGVGAFPDGPVRVKLLDDAPMVAWPPHLSPEMVGAGARQRGRTATDRVPNRRPRNHLVDGAGGHRLGGAAMARPPRIRCLVRPPAQHPPPASIARPGDVLALAGRTDPVPTRDADDRDRHRGRG